jgi:hypothetical protein
MYITAPTNKINIKGTDAIINALDVIELSTIGADVLRAGKTCDSNFVIPFNAPKYVPINAIIAVSIVPMIIFCFNATEIYLILRFINFFTHLG